MTSLSRKAIQELVGFLKYEMGPYILLANKISERIRDKPVINLDESKLLFRSSTRLCERLLESAASLNMYDNSLLTMLLFAEGMTTYLPILSYDWYRSRRATID